MSLRFYAAWATLCTLAALAGATLGALLLNWFAL